MLLIEAYIVGKRVIVNDIGTMFDKYLLCSSIEYIPGLCEARDTSLDRFPKYWEIRDRSRLIFHLARFCRWWRTHSSVFGAMNFSILFGHLELFISYLFRICKKGAIRKKRTYKPICEHLENNFMSAAIFNHHKLYTINMVVKIGITNFMNLPSDIILLMFQQYNQVQFFWSKTSKIICRYIGIFYCFTNVKCEHLFEKRDLSYWIT